MLGYATEINENTIIANMNANANTENRTIEFREVEISHLKNFICDERENKGNNESSDCTNKTAVYCCIFLFIYFLLKFIP